MRDGPRGQIKSLEFLILLAPDRRLETQGPVLEVPALYPAHPWVRKHITDQLVLS